MYAVPGHNVDCNDIYLRRLIFFILHFGYVHTKPDKFENATFAAKTNEMFSATLSVFSATFISKHAIQSDNRHNNIINNSSAILDQWLRKDCVRVTWLLWRQRFQKVSFSLSTVTHLAGVFKFIHFRERFQKVPFSDTENAVLVWTEGLYVAFIPSLQSEFYNQRILTST